MPARLRELSEGSGSYPGTSPFRAARATYGQSHINERVKKSSRSTYFLAPALE
jgi:hypothetical protein